jgi:SOS response regulatory protein OraA/RecX
LDNAEREARSIAISYIGISRKSSGRVSDYLKNKGISRDTSDTVIQQLILDGYIDDVRIARSMIASRTDRKTEAKSMLLRRLTQAGISRDAILSVKGDIPEDRESILVLVDQRLMPDYRKQNTLDTFDADAWINKSFRFLVSKGYSSTLSLDTLRNRIRDVE